MSIPEVEVVELVEEASPRYVQAAQVLERAVQAGCTEPNVLYLLHLAYKRQRKPQEARAALRKIQKPDSNVFLQMGLLSLDENNLVQAEGEFLRAWEADKTSYEALYNLMMTRMSLGRIDECQKLMPQAMELVGSRDPKERQFLQTLAALFKASQRIYGDLNLDPQLTDMTPEVEQRLVKLFRSLGQVDVVYNLLRTLADSRPNSMQVREAYYEAGLVRGRTLMDRCAFGDADATLKPLAPERAVSRQYQAALLNMIGVCAACTHDVDTAVAHFAHAVKVAPNDPRLHQNLALAYELQNDLSEADPHWNRYLDLLDRKLPAPPDIPEYITRLEYESLSRIAAKYQEKERWSSALSYVQRAARLKPDDPDTLERLFFLFSHSKRPKDARRVLDQLRDLRPKDPRYDLYELDLIEVKGLNDIERLLTEIDDILRRHPGDVQVEERAISMVDNVIPLMGNLCDQLTDQMSKVIDQVRHLPNYQINWSAVREVMRDLLSEFKKLRRITGKCLPLVKNDERKRMVRDLADHIDRKMEACRSMGA